MTQLPMLQLAELLVGIARAQSAVIQGIESALAGTKSRHIVPQLQSAAHLRDHPEPTLLDLPARILLASQGRVPPDPAAIARELERLIGGSGAPAGGDSLDFSKTG